MPTIATVAATHATRGTWSRSSSAPSTGVRTM